jgi:hypothetical protein
MTRPNLNAVALVPPSIGRAVASTGFCVLRATSIEARWLFYFVQTAQFVKGMTALVQGVLYPAVRPKDILSYEIPIAPVPEQDRVVGEIEKHFTRLDTGVAALERARFNLKRYRAAVLKAACEGRLVPTEATLARMAASTSQRTRSSRASWVNAEQGGKRISSRRSNRLAGTRRTTNGRPSTLSRSPLRRKPCQRYRKGGHGLASGSWHQAALRMACTSPGRSTVRVLRSSESRTTRTTGLGHANRCRASWLARTNCRHTVYAKEIC